MGPSKCVGTGHKGGGGDGLHIGRSPIPSDLLALRTVNHDLSNVSEHGLSVRHFRSSEKLKHDPYNFLMKVALRF